MSDPFLYDIVDYPGAARPQTHPDNLAAIARLHGVAAASPTACHYLEVGCGDAANLLPLALAYPESRFVGIDLSEVAVARGEALRRELGLTNLRLDVADLTRWTPPAEPFDYICAHGFYSWVPPHVRDALLQLCDDTLAASGVAYVSYNALPGCHLRQMLWEMLRAHVAAFDDPETKLQQAYALLRLLEKGILGEAPAAQALRREVAQLIHRTHPSVLFHDDLAGINTPVSIRDFAAHAGRFRLGFLAEADYAEMNEGVAPEPVAAMLRAAAQEDVLQKEQYLDFFKVRRFRQTLLCRTALRPAVVADPAAVAQCSVQGAISPETVPVDLSPGVFVRFGNDEGTVFQVNTPVLKAAMTILGEEYPLCLGFGDLLSAAGRRAGAATEEDADALRKTLVAAFLMGVVNLRLDPPAFGGAPAERPRASPLVRAQLRGGTDHVTSLQPSTVVLENPVLRELMALMDGSRDRDALLTDLAAAMDASGEALPANVAPTAGWRGCLDGELDENLRLAARIGLLMDG